MNQQPLNLLTTAPADVGAVSSQASDSEHQLALANLFSSLSSLAQQQQALARPQLDGPQATPPAPMTAAAAAAASLQQMLPTMHQQIHPSNFASNTKPQQQDTSFVSFMSQQQDLQVSKQQQRINYCTICNKELCNKYFMKTHMLKMHGINLEMEQPIEGETNEDEEGEEEDEGEREELSEVPTEAMDLIQNDESSQPLDCKKVPPSSKPTSLSKKSPQNSNSKQKQKLNTTGGGKSATSVLNGFAGNSMGGVVCDICNKELCSKYFLKVHKQNTHGIVTDYSDSSSVHHHSQFMYPFGPAVPPFMAPAPVSLPNTAAFPPILMPTDSSLSLFNSCSATPTTTTAPIMEPKRSIKRPRMSTSVTSCSENAQSNIEPQASAISLLESSSSREQLESVYRLIIAQQHQHQQPAPMSMHPTDSQMLNPAIGALMCFGALGPAATGPFGGPAAISPAMIVDHILRNQHLFNNRGANNPVQAGSRDQADKNNNNSNNGDNNKANKSSTSKDSSNSRYYSHYTEACPMCERRFKSIKWLKTHMMNDHKQEIGAYMQMMMQYLYASKSQQMAATMAVLEQQQQQQQSFAHQLSGGNSGVHHQHHHLNLQFPATLPLPPPPPTQASAAPVRHHQNQPTIRRLQHNPTTTQQQLMFQQQQPVNVMVDGGQLNRTSTTSATSFQQEHYNNPKQRQLMMRQEEDFVFGTHCRQESQSPNNLAAGSLLASPSTPGKLSVQTQHNFQTQNELTFDLDRFQPMGRFEGRNCTRGSDEDEAVDGTDNSSDRSSSSPRYLNHLNSNSNSKTDTGDPHHIKTTSS